MRWHEECRNCGSKKDEHPVAGGPEDPACETYESYNFPAWAIEAVDRINSDNEVNAAFVVMGLVEQAVTHKPSPLQTGTEGSVPEGWKLVPIEPTEEMKLVGAQTLLATDINSRAAAASWAYQSMISVSPPPPVLERQENNHADGNEPVVVEKSVGAHDGN